jgi:hypothetical protein
MVSTDTSQIYRCILSAQNVIRTAPTFITWKIVCCNRQGYKEIKLPRGFWDNF